MELAQSRESVVEYGFRRSVVTTAIIIATLLEIVDVTIVNVALPNIQGGFSANVEQAAWIGTGYIIANVIIIPITPWLQTRFGRKQYYFASILLFTVASLMCGLSQSLNELIFWRIVQGTGGGGLISTSQAILVNTFPRDKQGMSSAIFGMGVVVGPTIGPWIGGLIVDHYSWREAFFINIPLGIIAMLLVAVYLRNPEGPRKIPLDGVGLALLAIGIGSLQYVLDQGNQKDWFDDGWIVAFSVIAALGLCAFVLFELLVAKRPIVNLRILRYRSVTAGSLLGMCLGVSLYGTVLVLPQYVQGSLGFTATDSGLLLMVRAAPLLFLMPLSARLATSGKFDARWQVATGFVLLGISNYLVATKTTTGSDFGNFVIPLMLSGLGLSQIFVPLTLSVINAVEPRDVPSATAFFNLARQLGGSVAIAVLVTLLTRQSAAYHTSLAAQIHLSRPAVADYVAHNGGPRSESMVTHLNGLVTAQSMVLAYADVARATAYLTLLVTPFVLIMRRAKRATAFVTE
ncbi:MAG TPA: DHA2 family efflux MFS transporter permease subunit [Candidatus Binatia bacterium]|nr:DHA2 family efflux MFS transporter permease subunit [Candidatus Binatia bacterium]